MHDSTRAPNALCSKTIIGELLRTLSLTSKEAEETAQFLAIVLGESYLLSRLHGEKPGAAQLDSAHWLEVEDTRHRYGTYLQPYHAAWLASGSTEGFFDFLDRGSGRNLDLTRTSNFSLKGFKAKKIVSRETLERSCVRYCTPQERMQYCAIIEQGVLYWANDHRDGLWRQYERVHTDDEHRWIFVMGLGGDLYLNRKEKAKFHHSSFFAGARVRAAGRIAVRDGFITLIEPRSGHYKTTAEQFKSAIVDLVLSGAAMSKTQVNFNMSCSSILE